MEKEIHQEIVQLIDLCSSFKSKSKFTVGEKKTILIKIEAALGKSEIVRYITECSETADDDDEMDFGDIGPKLTWINLYKNFVYFINLELSNFRKSNEKKTKSLSKIESFNCLKLIATNGCGANCLNVNDVCKFLADCLDDDCIASVHFIDLNKIIDGAILKNSGAFCELSRENFDHLLKIYVDIVKLSPENGSDSCLSTLKNLLQVGVYQFDLDFISLLKDFCTILENTDKQKSNSYWSNLIICSNILMKFYGFNNREEFCSFGERVADKILALLNQTNVDQYVVEFFLFQMVFHHPNNALTSDAMLIGKEWKNVVKSLYVCLSLNVESSCLKSQSTSAFTIKRIDTSKLNELFARVLIQVFNWDEEINNVPLTQFNSSFSYKRKSDGNIAVATQRKPVSLEVSWAPFVQNLEEKLNSSNINPWLLILQMVLCKFFRCIDGEDLILIAKFVIKTITVSKRPDVLNTGVQIAKILVDNLGKTHRNFTFVDLWKQLYDVSKRLSFVKTVQNEIFDVLSSIIDLDLIEATRVQNDLCLVFASFAQFPTINSSNFLFNYLQRYEFSEKSCNYSLLETDSVENELKFRSFLIQWLLCKRNIFDDVSLNASYKVFLLLPPHILARNLQQICFKRPFGMVNFIEKESIDGPGKFENISFDLVPSQKMVAEQNGLGHFAVQPEMLTELVDLVICYVGQIFDEILVEPDSVEVKILNSAMSFGFFVSSWLKTFQNLNILDDYEQKFDGLWKLAERRCVSLEAKNDLVEKFIPIFGFLERNEFLLTPGDSFVVFFTFLSGSIRSRVTNINRENEDSNEAAIDDVNWTKFVRNTFEFFTLASSYRFDCNFKSVAERFVLDLLKRLGDDEGEFSLNETDLADVVSSICKTGFKNRCTVSFARLALSLVKIVLDRGYKNHTVCQKLLESCYDLPINRCFDDDEVREQFFRIIAGFKKISGQIKYTSKVKTALVHCLLNIERKLPGSKISLNENNNDADISVTTFVLEISDGGSLEFDELCKNITLLTKTRFDANNCLELLLANAVKDVAQPVKVQSLIRAAFKLMKNSSNFISICLFTLCKICRHSYVYYKNILEIFEKSFSSDMIDEILNVNLNFCVLHWSKVYEDDWNLFPYHLWKADSFDEFLSKHFAPFVFNSSEFIRRRLIKTTKIQFDQLVLQCFPIVFVNYFALNDISASAFSKQFTILDLEKCIKDNFCNIMCSLTERICFEKDLLPGEVSVKTWESIVRIILKTIRCESITQFFIDSPKDVLMDVFLTFRSLVCSKLYSIVNFKRYFCFVSSLNYACFTSVTSIVVRETLLAIKFVVQNAQVDDEILNIVLRLCRKMYSETDQVFVQLSYLIWLPILDFDSQIGSTLACNIIKYLFRCLSDTKSDLICNTPLLPKIETFAELREIQLRQRMELTLSQDIDQVLATVNDSIRLEDLEYLVSKFNLKFESVWSINKTKISALLDKCRSLCAENSLAPIASKFIDICCRRGFTINAVSVNFFHPCKPIFHQILEMLVDEIQSENPIIARSSWQCLRQFLTHDDVHIDFKFDHDSCFKSFVTHFKHSPTASRRSVVSLTSVTSAKISLNGFDQDFTSFDDWILKFLPTFISSQAIFAPLKEICERSVSFCEEIFPCIFEFVLTKTSRVNRQIFGRSCNKLFSTILTTRERLNKNDLRKFTSLFLQLIRRLQNLSEIEKPFGGCSLLEIDYRLLAELCLFNGFYCESLMFLEIESEKFRTKFLNTAIYKDKSKKNFLSCLHERFLFVLREIYPKLNNVDAIYGLGEASLSNSFIRSFLWNAEHEWNKAVSFYSSLDSADSSLLQKATFALGLDENFLKLDENSKELQSYRCQCAVRLGLWDTVEVSKKSTTNFHQLVFDAINSNDVRKEYFLDVGMTLLKDNACSNGYQSFIEKACLLNEMRIYFDEFSSLPSDLIKKWNDDESNFVENQFVDGNLVDIIRSFRWAVLHKHVDDVPKDAFVNVVNCFVKLTERRIDWYRSKNMPSVAIKAAKQFQTRIGSFSQTVPACSFYVGNLKEVEILFDSGEQFLAVSKLKSLIEMLSTSNKTPTSDSLHFTAKCYILLGEYQTKFDSPEAANDSWNRAASMLEILPPIDGQVVQTLCSAFASMAQYADENYQSLTDYIKSSQFVSKNVYIEKFKPVSEMVKQGKQILSLAGRRSHLDKTEVMEMIETQQNLMQAAVAYYLRCLALTSEYDLKIFRVISLWFDNLDSASLAQSFVEFAGQIPTHKWLLVWTQLTSRLSAVKNDPFVGTVYEIIQKTALDHPFHTFYALFALKTATPNENDDRNKQLRRQAAEKMICQLTKSFRAGIFEDLDNLAKSYVEIGDIKTQTLSRTGKKLPIPNGYKLLTYSCDVPVVTVDLKVQPSTNYRNFVSVVKFENYFSIANGKSAPAVVYCVCSDGKTRKQLVKGHDDMRQDAIIEQVFGIVNVLLQKKRSDGNTNDALSRIRTYNVIPLSPLCGVIEWCEGAISFGDYLVGTDHKGGAHKRVYPDDWTGSQCRLAVGDVNKREFDENLKIFLSVCDNLQPVFRHFFFEKFQQPILWYDAHEKYTRSVAVSSMVGHVLGLSDRHTQNILVDESTAELIQIDLGMAFEQGRILPTPERVPFRLTRDIIDGMGVCGVDGVFRRSCERVMRLLRDSRDVLVPIVSVLLHDPVSDWVLNDEKIKKVQSQNAATKRPMSENKNEHAERAILKVVDKLKGMEKTSILTVEGQVTYLINQASDMANLCQMFVGWQAYL